MNAWPFIPAPQPANSGHPTPLLPLVTALLALAVIPLCSAPAEGRHGVVATVHPLASDAALQAMKHGGNAIDAAVAAALTLGVVDGHNSGIGGGCFLLIRLADGTFAAIDGRETAPGAATLAATASLRADKRVRSAMPNWWLKAARR